MLRTVQSRRVLIQVISLVILVGAAAARHPLCDLYESLGLASRVDSNELEGWTCSEEDIGNSYCDGWTGVECSSGSIVTLDLSDMNLGGTIPSSLGSLTSLRRLYLDNNLLSGTIPSSITALSRLQCLQLSFNNLRGPVPSDIGNLEKLDRLYLSHNELTGTIPSSLSIPKKLHQVAIDNNMLTGALPSELSKMAKRATLDFAWNSLSGVLPQELCNAKSLFVFDNAGIINNCDTYCSITDEACIVSNVHAGIDYDALAPPIISI